MTGLQELEASAEREVKIAEIVETAMTTENQLLVDLIDSIALLESTKRLLGYISDSTLCRSISERERAAIQRVLKKIDPFLLEMQTAYEEG